VLAVSGRASGRVALGRGVLALALLVLALMALASCGSKDGASPGGPGGAGIGGGAAGTSGAAGSGGAGSVGAGAGGAGGSSAGVTGDGGGGAGIGAQAGQGADAATDAPADVAVDAPTDGSSPADADAGQGGGLLQPIMRGALDVLEIGDLQLKVNPAVGARIVGFSLGGDELLTDATANAQFYGSTLWTSPADDWVVPGTFVPPPAVDNQLYGTTVGADGTVTAVSKPYTTPNAKKLVVTKVFRADLARQAVTIDYAITNTGTTPYQISHWEVTRVFPGGLTFFTTPATAPKLDFLKQPMQLQAAQGYTWYDNETHVNGKGESKSGSQSAGGFIAHVAPQAGGDLLFVKAFDPIVAPAQPPTGHMAVELYCNDPHTYVELEEHSAFKTVMPGATYTHTVRWFVRRLPAGTDRGIGSAALIAAVKGVLGQ
jgi:hypothetical protein